MTSDVVLGSALRTNLLSLQNTQSLIDRTQLRLATGREINSALDGAQNFFASQSLTNRARDFGRLQDGIGQSIRTIEAASQGVTSLTTLLDQASSIANEAQTAIRAAAGFAAVRGSVNLSTAGALTKLGGGGVIANGDDLKISFFSSSTGLKTSADIDIATTDTIDNIVAEINADTTINPYIRASLTSEGQLRIESLVAGGLVRIADGSTTPGADGFAALGLSNFVTSEGAGGAGTTRQGGTVVSGRTITSNVANAAAKNGAVYEASSTLNTAAYFTSSANTLQLNISVDGQTSANLNFLKTDTIQDVVDGINNDATLGDNVSASFNTSTGRIEVRAADTVGNVDVRFTAVGGAATSAFGFGTGGSDFALTTAGNSISERFTFSGNSSDITQFEEDYQKVRLQIDDLVQDAGYRGVNLLNSNNLVTFFNEDRSNSLTTTGVDFTALGLGITQRSFTDTAQVQGAIDELRRATNTVRNFGSSISNDLSIIQTRQDFTSNTIRTLRAGADDLTVADQNEEGATLLALQTRQQLGVTSLSLASQSQQAVLRLF